MTLTQPLAGLVSVRQGLRAIVVLVGSCAVRCASIALVSAAAFGCVANSPPGDGVPDAATDRGAGSDSKTVGDVALTEMVSVDAAAAPSIELGSGQDGWQHLPATGGRTEIVFGPQGGYHIFGRARLRGFSPGLRGSAATSGVNLRFEVTPAEGGPALTDPGGVNRWEQTGLVRLSEGEYESAFAELVILTAIRGPLEVVGRSFRLEVIARENATGRTASASREVVIVDEHP